MCCLFLQDRDAFVGAPHHTDKCEALATSRKVIIVLSNSYMTSSQCKGEADLAGKLYQKKIILLT